MNGKRLYLKIMQLRIFFLLHLFDKYDAKIYKAIIEQSPFHKLSYKFTEEQIESEGTNYRKLFCEEAKV